LAVTVAEKVTLDP
jgi:hypothetical protein